MWKSKFYGAFTPSTRASDALVDFHADDHIHALVDVARRRPRLGYRQRVLRVRVQRRLDERGVRLVGTCVEIKFRAPHAIGATCFRDCVCAMAWRFHAIDATLSE